MFNFVIKKGINRRAVSDLQERRTMKIKKNINVILSIMLIIPIVGFFLSTIPLTLIIFKEYTKIAILVLELVILFVLLSYPIIETVNCLVKKKKFLNILLFIFLEIIITLLLVPFVFYSLSIMFLIILILKFIWTNLIYVSIKGVLILIISGVLFFLIPVGIKYFFNMFQEIVEIIYIELLENKELEEILKKEQENDENNNNIQQ